MNIYAEQILHVHLCINKGESKFTLTASKWVEKNLMNLYLSCKNLV